MLLPCCTLGHCLELSSFLIKGTSQPLWHSLAASGSVLILVIVSALTYVITNKAGTLSRKPSTRKSGRHQSNKRKPTRKRAVRSQGG